MKAIRYAGAVLGIALLTTSVAAQTTRYFPSASNPTLQSAVDASSPGDTIIVLPGVHQVVNVNVFVPDLLIRGVVGPQFTVFDAQGLGRHLRYPLGNIGDNSRLESITFQNGAAPDGEDKPQVSHSGLFGCDYAVGENGGPGEGGGSILVEGAGLAPAGTLSISRCIFRSNRAGDGGDGGNGADGHPCDVGFTGGFGGEGGLGGRGGAMQVASRVQLEIQSTVFYGNRSGRGGRGGNGGDAVVGGCAGSGGISRGFPTIWVVAPELSGVSRVARGCTFYSNQAGDPGAGGEHGIALSLCNSLNPFDNGFAADGFLQSFVALDGVELESSIVWMNDGNGGSQGPDPQFVNAPLGDLRLSFGSSLVDSLSTASWGLPLPAKDLYGNPRAHVITNAELPLDAGAMEHGFPLSGANYVFILFGSNGALADGSLGKAFGLFGEAQAAALPGQTYGVGHGTYSESPLVLSKPATIEAIGPFNVIIN